MVAGALSTVREQLTPGESRSTGYLLRRAKSAKERWLVLAGRPALALFKGFADEDKMLALMGVGLATAFLGVIAQLLFLNLGGASYVTSVSILNVGFLQGLRLVAAYGSMLVLYLAFVIVHIYFMSLLMIDNKPIGTALVASVHACMKNAVPCLVYSMTLVLPLLIAGLISKSYPLAGLIGLLGVGSVAVPLLITSAYCTARLMYRTQ